MIFIYIYIYIQLWVVFMNLLTCIDMFKIYAAFQHFMRLTFWVGGGGGVGRTLNVWCHPFKELFFPGTVFTWIEAILELKLPLNWSPPPLDSQISVISLPWIEAAASPNASYQYLQIFSVPKISLQQTSVIEIWRNFMFFLEITYKLAANAMVGW